MSVSGHCKPVLLKKRKRDYGTTNKKLLDVIASELKQIDGVKAIALSGSFAIGRATENSDLGLGIYYSEQNPFDIEKVKK